MRADTSVFAHQCQQRWASARESAHVHAQTLEAHIAPPPHHHSMAHRIRARRARLGSARRAAQLHAHLNAQAACACVRAHTLVPTQLRTCNIGVSGINLHALIHCKVEIGDCVLQITGDCPPCQRMETTIGPGGLAAMSGLGGVTASVIRAGAIRVGDRVRKA